ncbi:MAG: 6-bladed beta-propeller [Verrucomicrobiae bacterium]|nr:6-bladed beta-propeller [Verrucomicrobiae bacterium]
MKLKGIFLLYCIIGWLSDKAWSEDWLKPKFLFEFGKRGLGDGEFGGEDVLDNDAIQGPKDIAVDWDNKIYVLDTQGDEKARVQVFTSNGVFIGKFGSVGNGPEQFSEPESIAVGRLGDIYVSDGGLDCVHVFDKNFNYKKRFGIHGSGPGQFNWPTEIAIRGEDVYVMDGGNKRVQAFDSQGSYLSEIKFPEVENLSPEDAYQYLGGIAFDAWGNLHVSLKSVWGNKINVYDSQGKLVRSLSTQNPRVFSDLAVLGQGYILGSDWVGSVIQIYRPFSYQSQFGLLGNDSGQFDSPYGLAVNPLQRDKLYVADWDNHRIQVFAFETITNFNAFSKDYVSGDFLGDGYADLIVYRSGKFSTTHGYQGDDSPRSPQTKLLNFYENTLVNEKNISSLFWKIPEGRAISFGKPILGNSMGVLGSLVFKCKKYFALIHYWVDEALPLWNSDLEARILPIPFKIGHLRASGDLNQDGFLDLVLVKKQTLRVLLGPDYRESKEIKGLTTPLPGRVHAIYHQGEENSALVFQKRRENAVAYSIAPDLTATFLKVIPVRRKIRAMMGATPVVKKGRKIKAGSLRYRLPRSPYGNGTFKIIGPR